MTLLAKASLARERAGPERVQSPRAALLRNRRVLFLVAGHFLSALAPMMQRALVLIWVYALTGSGKDVGFVGLAEALALLAAAPLAGVFADR